MDIKEQRDAFIREKLSNDKKILEPSLNICENYLNDTKIKQKRYTRRQKNILLFVVALLIISFSFNVYLLSDKNSSTNIATKTPTPSDDNLLISNNDEENLVTNETIVEEILVTNDIPENTTTNETNNTVSINANTKNILSSSEFKSEEFKKILELYALGIHRIYDANSDETEKNTIKLLTVLRYLDYCSQNNNDNNNSAFSIKYAALKENVYLCLTELTKTNYPTHILPTYQEFVKYINTSNSFAYGDNSSILTNESYEILELKPYEGTNNNYNIETKIKRTVKADNDTTFEDTFDVKFVVSLNSDYTYSKYKIESMHFENESKNAPNRTYNLLDTSMFSQNELTEIKNAILKQTKNNDCLVYFDNITEESKNNYSISYRIITDDSYAEEKVTVSKKENKLDIKFKN